MASSNLDALREHIAQIWLVDTHEHITHEEDWLTAEEGIVDFSRFFVHYASVDVVSAGFKSLDKLLSPETALDEKWEIFEPYWLKARNTAYCKSVDLAIQGLFDLPGLSRDTYRPLTDKMREMRKPGYYRYVLKEKAKIEVSILDTGMVRPDREFFAPVVRMDHFIMARTRQDLHNIEKESGVSVHSLDGLVDALATVVQKKTEHGIAGIKSGLAYVRTLNYENPSKAAAENAFSEIFAHRGALGNDGVSGISSGQAKVLQDYMFHKVVQQCIEHDLPVQIHTGIQEGNGNYLQQTNPALLNDVFMTYPNARFDIFHAGYPYWGELGVMCKMFPGVHADLCWMNIISCLGARRALSEWLEIMPASKIFAFGGDYAFVEGAYSHSVLARENVAQVLAEKVDNGYFSLEEAKSIANRILRDNANEFFKLGL